MKYGYDGYLTSDTSPTRWDIKKMFEANNRLRKMAKVVEQMKKRWI